MSIELSRTYLFHSDVQREWNKVISCETVLPRSGSDKQLSSCLAVIINSFHSSKSLWQRSYYHHTLVFILSPINGI